MRVQYMLGHAGGLRPNGYHQKYVETSLLELLLVHMFSAPRQDASYLCQPNRILVYTPKHGVDLLEPLHGKGLKVLRRRELASVATPWASRSCQP